LKSEETPADAGASDYSKLTAREREVLCCVAEGLSNKEIAERLFISVRTVENHRYSIGLKMGFKSTLDLIRYAVRYGLVDSEMWKD
jgi:DNA-binding NarL/FixJ family response regulator